MDRCVSYQGNILVIATSLVVTCAESTQTSLAPHLTLGWTDVQPPRRVLGSLHPVCGPQFSASFAHSIEHTCAPQTQLSDDSLSRMKESQGHIVGCVTIRIWWYRGEARASETVHRCSGNFVEHHDSRSCAGPGRRNITRKASRQ